MTWKLRDENQYDTVLNQFQNQYVQEIEHATKGERIIA
jgi:hypothetical protein